MSTLWQGIFMHALGFTPYFKHFVKFYDIVDVHVIYKYTGQVCR